MGVLVAEWEGNRERLLDEIDRFLAGVRGDAEPDRVLATLLFADVVQPPNGLHAWPDRLVRAQLARFRGREVDRAGGGWLATFDGPARAVRCAATIVASVRDLGVEMRAGVHTGEIERSETGARGSAVDVGARLAAIARPGEVLVSSTVRDLVAGSGIEFEPRGPRDLKGLGEWPLFAVVTA